MIPVGDSPRRHRTPWVNYAFILINIGVFIYMVTLTADLVGTDAQLQQDFEEQTAGVCYGFRVPPSQADRFVCEWAFQPREFFDAADGEADLGGQDRWAVLFTVITSMFMHGGWLHIAGNMLFLWVFGDNVEDRFGHLRYAIFYLFAGAIAALIQGLIDTDSLVPVLGASGAVAGVLGAYIVWFPKATVNVVIPFFILIFIPIPVPAILMIGLWFVQNLLSGYATIADAAAPDQGVAWFAHIGGFLFGMFTVLLLFRRTGERRRYVPPPPRWR